MADYTPIKTVVQAFEILDLLSDNQKMGISEMARVLSLPKSTIYRNLRTLSDLAIVEQDANENYHLGYKILTYQNQIKSTDTLVNQLKPFMQNLVRTTGESVNLGILLEDEVLILHTEYGDQYTLQTHLSPTTPLHCSGIGKLFLHTWSDEKLTAYFFRAERRTIHTITELEPFKAHMTARADAHLAIDNEEYEYGLMCIATPILDAHHQIRAALSISGPVSRLEHKGLSTIKTALLNEAQEATDYLQNIGYWK